MVTFICTARAEINSVHAVVGTCTAMLIAAAIAVMFTVVLAMALKFSRAAAMGINSGFVTSLH